MIFFTDESFMYHANALVEAFDRKNEIRPMQDHFPRGTPDIEWISAVSNWTPKPTVICGDGRVLKNKVERQVLKEAGLTFICLRAAGPTCLGRNSPGKIIYAWPAICVCATAIRPTVFEVSVKTMKVEKQYQLI
ncbi:MAG TPA: hypothetical protein VHY37_07235 [Tepidisphaeraceae bacterium]|jgi:hypothetical protein|nr:hypothetical protein [Tepidisphaeraceae bacterium]